MPVPRVRPSRAAAVRLTKALAVFVVLAVAVYASTVLVPYADLLSDDDPLLRTDVARLSPARVQHIDTN